MVETRKNSPTKRVFLDNSYKTKGEQILMLPSRQEFARFFGALGDRQRHTSNSL